MQSQSQNRSQPESPDAVAISRKVAPTIPQANDADATRNSGAARDGTHGLPAGSSPVTPDSDPHERQARIAAEAYRIAEERGFPANSAVDHWYEAQRRLGYAGLDLAASSNGSTSERM